MVLILYCSIEEHLHDFVVRSCMPNRSLTSLDNIRPSLVYLVLYCEERQKGDQQGVEVSLSDVHLFLGHEGGTSV